MKTRTFTQIINHEKLIKSVADGYKTKIPHDLWLVEGLQKDAIQNSWDARVDKRKGSEWECGFFINKIDNREFLCIIDSGTTGLRGTKFFTQKGLNKILIKNRPGEDLAYFLNSNWSAKSAEEGGNRGRGKTLFLVASQDKKIFFDSLRKSDNAYIFGELYLDKDKQVKFNIYYDNDAREAFKKFANESVPFLAKCGTRIFVSNPEKSIEKAIEEGEMNSFIGRSWWEIIKNYQAKIFIKSNNEKKYIELPYWYEEKLKNIKSEEIYSKRIREGTDYKIKKLVLRYAPNSNLPEFIRGIAIQRGGMTVQRFLGEQLIHEEGMVDVYGWLEMEDSLEKAMKDNCEGPEHLDFSWNTNPARFLRDYIRYKLRDFAKELKIIESEQTKKDKIKKTAEEEALKYLTPIFKKLKLFGKHKGKKYKKKSKRKPNELLRLSVSDIRFPRDSRRVNYGDKIKGAYVIPINESKEKISVLVRVFVLSADGEEKIIEEKEINLSPGVGDKIGIDYIDITKDYKEGGYSFKASMISLEDKKTMLADGTKIEKGTILYNRINQKFYVEIDPPESGPFNFQPRSKEDKKYLFEWELEEDNGYTVFYNDLHPRIKNISDNVEKLTTYLIEQGILIALQIKLEELIAEGKNADKNDKEFCSLIHSNNLDEVWPTLLRKYSEFLWNFKEHGD